MQRPYNVRFFFHLSVFILLFLFFFCFVLFCFISVEFIRGRVEAETDIQHGVSVRLWGRHDLSSESDRLVIINTSSVI